MLFLYPILIILGIFILGTIFILFSQKNISRFLSIVITIAFWVLLIFSIFSISMQLFVKDSTIKTSETSSFTLGTNFKKGYNIPVEYSITFPSKKVYSTKNSSFTKYDDETKNFYDDDFLRRAGTSKKELDSIFKFSPEVKKIGKELIVDNHLNSNNGMTITSSSFVNKEGYITVKSSKWYFTAIQILQEYLRILFTLIILYQLKTLFKLLKQKINFSLILAQKVKVIGLLIIVYQLIQLTFSIFYMTNYSYASFKDITMTDIVTINITPRLEFEYSYIIIGLSLLVLHKLLSKGDVIQQENDLTI